MDACLFVNLIPSYWSDSKVLFLGPKVRSEEFEGEEDEGR
jgi:hypothetical protein